MNPNSTLVLIDAHAVVHRAYHALPDFVSSAGEPTGALYGLSTFIIKIIKDLKPDYIAACYDLPGPTFRHEAYAEYKAHRPKTEEALVSQLIRSRDVFMAFGIPIYDAPGFEADDIIGTIVQKLKAKSYDLKAVIASGDMDTLQLVDDDRVVAYTLKKGMSDTLIYNEDAVRERFGFDPKLLADYKGLRGDPSDNIIGIAGIGEKTATELIRNFGSIENIYSKLMSDPSAFEKAGIKSRIVKLLSENEEEALFSKTLATIRKDAPIDFVLPDRRWVESFDSERAAAFLGGLGFRSVVGRLGDIKDGENNKEEKIEEDNSDLSKAALALWILDSRKTDPDRSQILDYAGAKNIADAEKILDQKIAETGRLKDVYENIEIPLMPILSSAEKFGIALDREYLLGLSKEYHGELSRIEKEIWKVAGEEFNVNSPKQLGEILFTKLGIKTKGVKKTGGGAVSTRESELTKLAGIHPIMNLILSHRELQKLLSTYIDVLPNITDVGGRLHTRFVQTGTATGRLSSRDPNIQNIPTKTELGRRIRRAFVAPKGCSLYAFDYSQIELRVLAMLSGDPTLSRVFREGGDIHQEVAEQVFHVSHTEVTKEMRRRAKVINFGIIYGMGINALRENLGTTREEAQKFYDEYFKNFSRIGEWMEETKAFARAHGFTETLYGRRRYFPNIAAGPHFMRAAEERMAVNAPDQGTAADIIKLAMIRADEALRESGLVGKVRLLMQVHDELVFEIDDGSADRAVPIIRETMEGVTRSGEVVSEIPFVANVSRGANWGEMTIQP